MGRMGTIGTDKTPNFYLFSILILIFENLISICENKFIYPFYPSHLLLSVPLYIPYLIRLKIIDIIYNIYNNIILVNKGNIATTLLAIILTLNTPNTPNTPNWSY
jgi:hypothetical protein